MRKINILLSFFMVVIFLLTSCKVKENSPVKDEISEPAKSVSDAVGLVVNPEKTNNLMDEENWAAVKGLDTGYVKLDDINPENVPEVSIGINQGMQGYIVRETTDGFLIGYQPKLSLSAVAQKNSPVIQKRDQKGKILWQKEYDHKTYTGNINNLAVYPDNSFIFSVQTYPQFDANGIVFEKSFIIKCDKDGNKLWEREFEDYSGSMLNYMFITENGEIIAVGRWPYKDSSQAVRDAPDDIVITKLDKDGNMLKQKSFGGSDFDMLNIAVYDRDLGILINGRTQSSDGDFAITNWERSLGFIALIDENLDFKWVVHEEGKESFIHDLIAASDGFVYVPGYLRGSSSVPPEGFLIKVDDEGKMVWKKQYLYSGLWGGAISVLQNGDIIIGSGYQNKGIIIVFDKDGNEKNRLEDLKYSPGCITPTLDGGFIVTSTRQIKPAPQPLYVSSIWFDTELVAVKYKRDLTIEWRKTYDRVKDKMGRDYVYPFEDGRIVVE